MITCSNCNAFMGKIYESEEIEVRGEASLHLMCPECKEMELVTLYEYNKERMNKNKKVG